MEMKETHTPTYRLLSEIIPNRLADSNGQIHVPLTSRTRRKVLIIIGHLTT